MRPLVLSPRKSSSSPARPSLLLTSTRPVLASLSPPPVAAEPSPPPAKTAKSRPQPQQSSAAVISPPAASKPEPPVKVSVSKASGASDLCAKWLGLQSVAEKLTALFGKPHNHVPPLVLHGVSGSGKTGLLTDLLGTLGLPNVFVFCPVVFSTKALYDHILNGVHSLTMCGAGAAKAGLGGDDEASDDDDGAAAAATTGTLSIQHDRFSEFVARLKAAWTRDETLYLVFDSAGHLSSLHPRLVCNIISLSRLTGRNVCPIFTCQSSRALLGDWSDWSDTPPACIAFPSPSQDVITGLLAAQLGTHPAVKPFLSQLWGLFAGLCGADLREFAYLADTLFPVFVASGGGGSAAFKSAVTVARASLFSHDLRFLDARAATKSSSAAGGNTTTSAPPLAPIARGVELELPYLSKFLLLAAYCASYNPPESDRIHFTRMSGKKGGRKRKRGAPVKETAGKRKKQAEFGHAEPKAFTLERLLTLFNSLVAASDGEPPPSDIASADMLTEISSLVTLHLLSRESAVTELDTPKFKCCIGAKTAFAVAKRLKVQLIAFLHEPELHGEHD